MLKFIIKPIKIITLLTVALLSMLLLTPMALSQSKDDQSSINLADYQLKPGILKIMITPETDPNFKLGVATLEESTSPGKYVYYQGVWLMQQRDNLLGYPLVLQRFVVYPEQTQGVLINKLGQMPYGQNLAVVQISSTTVQPVANQGLPNMIREPEQKRIHTPAGDFDTILIKTYNPQTKEGMIQYLAKDLGTIRLESYNKHHKYLVAELSMYRQLNDGEQKIIKQSLPQELQ